MNTLEMTFAAWLAFLSNMSVDMDVVLNPPATDQQLQTLEEAIGYALPDELVALYKITNGQQKPFKVETQPGRYAVNLMGHYDFLSTNEALAAYQFYRDITNDYGQLIDAEITVRDSHPVDSVSWKKGWLPIAGSGANQIAVDLAPPDGGRYGQLIPIGADEFERFVISPSLAEFFNRAAIETGTDECALDYGEPDNSDAHLPPKYRNKTNPYVLYIDAQWNHPFHEDNCAECAEYTINEQPDYINDSNAINERFRGWLNEQGLTRDRIDRVSEMSSIQLVMIMSHTIRDDDNQMWPEWLQPGGVIPQELVDSGYIKEDQFPDNKIPLDFELPTTPENRYFTELSFRLACQQSANYADWEDITIDEYRLFHRYLVIEGIWVEMQQEQAEIAMRNLPDVTVRGSAASGSFSCVTLRELP